MISFDSSIYKAEAVQQACIDYHELVDIRYKQKGKMIFCELHHPKGDEKLIADEFCNYVLNLSVLMGGAVN